MNIDQLLTKAKAEIESLNNEELGVLMSGYDNRGLDCISERWYGPKKMENNSALFELGQVILNIKELLRDFYEDYDWNE